MFRRWLMVMLVSVVVASVSVAGTAQIKRPFETKLKEIERELKDNLSKMRQESKARVGEINAKIKELLKEYRKARGPQFPGLTRTAERNRRTHAILTDIALLKAEKRYLVSRATKRTNALNRIISLLKSRFNKKLSELLKKQEAGQAVSEKEAADAVEELSASRACPKCGGAGLLECPVCKGTGKVTRRGKCPDCMGLTEVITSDRRVHRTAVPCKRCKATGKCTVELPCDRCFKKGKVECDRCWGLGRVYDRDDRTLKAKK